MSRYRETELHTKQRNWRPAVGYYDLATAIKPSSGFPHNQLAVIALADGNHMRVVYYLYRAATVEEPYPKACENLESEFKKILDPKNKSHLFPQLGQEPGDVLQAQFAYLHATLQAGLGFSGHAELEAEFLKNLFMELREHPMGDLLLKFTLCNIAAQHLARNHTKSQSSLFGQ